VPVRAQILTAASTALSLVFLAAPAAAAEDLTARQIADKALTKNQVGLQQGTAVLEMTIVSPRNEAKKRTLEVKAMRNDEGLLRSLVRFSKPAEVAGISFLVREKKDALPDQYVYVPAAKVVRQIAAGNAGSKFFGSDFTFGDLMPLPKSELNKVKLQRLDDAEVGKQPTYVIAATPQFEGSPYGKLLLYVHKEHLVPLKIEFFDPQMKLLKVLSVKKLKKIKGELTPVHLLMRNKQEGSRTELQILKPDPDAKLSDADFTEEAMQR
jgi:hypothetical protein